MLKAFAIFFGVGASMCALTIFLLVFPGTALDWFWRLNPAAHTSFASLGRISILLMSIVGASCAAAAIGLWRARRWAIRLALIILSINILGDLFNALVRHDYRALIGLPIGGAMIVYLVRRQKSPERFGA